MRRSVAQLGLPGRKRPRHGGVTLPIMATARPEGQDFGSRSQRLPGREYVASPRVSRSFCRTAIVEALPP